MEDTSKGIFLKIDKPLEADQSNNTSDSIKKHSFFLSYNKETEKIYNRNKVIPSSDILYTIIEKYNSMIKFLSNIDIVYNRSMEEADNNLVYRGIDSKDRYQYVYGKNMLIDRKKNRTINFLSVHNNIDKIQRIINEGLSDMDNITKSFIFSSILLIELTFFLRLGKDIHFKRNGTVGVLTLQRNHLTLNDAFITIRVHVEKKKDMTFTCTKEDHPILYKVLKKLYNNTKEENDFIMCTQDGSRFTERILNNLLKKLNVSLKDIRDYGRNLLFLKNIFINLEVTPVSNNKDISSLIVKCMRITNDALDNTYFSSSLITIINTVILRAKKFKSFDIFIQEIVKGIKNFE